MRRRTLQSRYGRSRLSKHWDLASEARAHDRFTFIARFVARATATAKGRTLSNGMQVKRLGAGWTYTMAGLQSTPGAVDAARLFDMIRRTPLNFYVKQAEDLREYALGGS